MGVTTVREIVIETSEAIFTVLKDDYMSFPSKDHLDEVVSRFWERWQFPNCFGAVDGKHVLIKEPDNAGSVYFNYKGTHSIVLMALVDADYRFLCVQVGMPGSECDSNVFQDWDFVRALEMGNIPLPDARQYPRLEADSLTIVGDGGFPLKTWLMVPFSDTGKLTDEEKIFNYRLSRARIVSENAFGILTQRWRVLRKVMDLSPQVAQKIVLACVTLHNWLRKTAPNCAYSPGNYMDRVSSDGRRILRGLWRDEQAGASALIPYRHRQTRGSQPAYQKRLQLSNFFQNAGSVEWQEKALTIGTQD